MVMLIQLLTAGVLGLLAGALLLEGALLVPYWRTLSAQAFYDLHPVYGPKLFRFFAPLTVAGPALATVAAVAAQVGGRPGRGYSAAAAVLAWGLVVIYLVHFKGANESLSKREVTPQALPGVLARWAAWHRPRAVVGLLAFAMALCAIAAG